MLKKLLVLVAVLSLAFGALMLTSGKTAFDVQNCKDVKASPGEVWQVLVDAPSWNLWWPGVKEAKVEPDWQVGASLQQVLAGDADSKPARITGLVPMMALAWERPGVLGSTVGTRLELGTASRGSSLCIASAISGPQAVLARVTGREEFEQYHQKVLSGLDDFLKRGESHVQ